MTDTTGPRYRRGRVADCPVATVGPTPRGFAILRSSLLGFAILGFVGVMGFGLRPAAAQEFKSLPPAGIEIDESTLRPLADRAAQLQAAIDAQARGSDDADRWQPDVEVFVRAVRLAIDQGLFYKPGDPTHAAGLLDRAEERLQAAQRGDRGLTLMGWRQDRADKPQPLVGGFVSEIDGSVQPYGLVVPADYRPGDEHPRRLDVWLHGRGDTKTEIPFLRERMTKPGQYAPAGTFVLHPFGRHCNAFKFAGETDVDESIDQVRRLVPVDPRRIAIRGFSMGGAGVWHLAVHQPGQWFAVNPGAGFVDTLVYQGWNDDPPFPLDPVQRRLLRWYDVLPWVRNLSNTRVIPYSGEVDKQRQAADRVVEVARDLGMDWPYVIGAGMGHKIDPASAETIDATIATWVAELPGASREEPGSPERERTSPRREIDFVTYTLRYPGIDWIEITGMAEHWTEARITGRIADPNTIELRTDGVTSIRLDFSESGWPGNLSRVNVAIDGERFAIESSPGDDAAAAGPSGFTCRLERAGRAADGVWTMPAPGSDDPFGPEGELRKRPGLQGPIDDAFTEPFLFVVPSGPTAHEAVGDWIERELAYAQSRWRTIMRGEVRVVRDTELTPQQIAENHLVCFGNFQSNRYLARVADRLPVTWTADELRLDEASFDPSGHAPAFCYPNPENPNRYVVVNSGMTFREFSNVSNSRQIAMLPDWAVIDVSEPGNGIYPGGVAAKGFFDESWGWRSDEP